MSLSSNIHVQVRFFYISEVRKKTIKTQWLIVVKEKLI